MNFASNATERLRRLRPQTVALSARSFHQHPVVTAASTKTSTPNANFTAVDSGIEMTASLGAALRPQAVNQWMLPYLAAMTPQYVEMLLRGGLFGNHVQMMELFTVMIDSSPEIAACVQEYTDGVMKKRVVFEPYHEEDEEPSDTALEKCKVVSAALRNMRPDASRDENGLHGTIKDIIFSRFHGMSILEADWHDTYNDGSRFIRDIPNLGEVQCLRSTYWVHPVCYAFDQTGKVGLTVTQDSIGQKTQQAKKDKSVTFKSSALLPRPNYVEPFPANNFIIAINKAKTGSVFGASALRPLAWWWVASNFCGDYLMKYAEIFGIPLRKATFDPNTPDATKREIRQLLQSAGSEPWTMMPKGVEIEFDRSTGGGGESPQAFLFHFANEMFRKVILHQTMSGGMGHSGQGAGKGGMESEMEGAKSDCIDAGAQFVETVFNLQIVPSVLYLNYGEDGDLEAPTVRLVDFEVGGLADAQRDTTLAAVMDVPDSYLRRKYGIPKPGPKDNLAGQEVGTQGAQAIAQQQQQEAQLQQQQDQHDERMAQAVSLAKQQQQKPQGAGGAGGQSAENPEEGQELKQGTDDGSGAVSGRRAVITASAATALAETLDPLIARLKAINAIKDKSVRVAALRKFLSDEPEITAALKHDSSLATALGREVTPKLISGLKSKP